MPVAKPKGKSQLQRLEPNKVYSIPAGTFAKMPTSQDGHSVNYVYPTKRGDVGTLDSLNGVNLFLRINSNTLPVIRTIHVNDSTLKICSLSVTVLGDNATIPERVSVVLDTEQLEVFLNCVTETSPPEHPDFNTKLAIYEVLSNKGGLTCGSDPEIFVQNEKGTVIPAWRYVPEPINIPGVPTRRYPQKTLFWDGVQAEFTVDADTCLAWTMDSVQRGLNTTLGAARMFNPKASLSPKTVTRLTKAQLAKYSPDHLAFGCNPVLNVYGLQPKRIKDGLTEPVRPAGGHIHFGLNVKQKESIPEIVKMMDRMLGICSVAMFHKYDKKERRELYGLAGEYREPEHGVEYRTLSNAWLLHPLLANICFEVGRTAALIACARQEYLWKGPDEKEVIRIIHELDHKAAIKIINNNVKVFDGIMYKLGLTEVKAGQVLVRLITTGAHNMLKEEMTIEKAWNLGTDDWTTHCDGVGKNISKAYTIHKNQTVPELV